VGSASTTITEYAASTAFLATTENQSSEASRLSQRILNGVQVFFLQIRRLAGVAGTRDDGQTEQ
jgi:hypothetical protein